jgi:carbonic anhydrase
MGCGASAGVAKTQLINVTVAVPTVEDSPGLEVGPTDNGATPLSNPESPKCLFPKSRDSYMGVRTARDAPYTPEEALKELRKGNKRFRTGKQDTTELGAKIRESLATEGQSPIAAIIGCADSRVPIEILFDSQPGELFVLRNAGNTCMCAEGSIVGSLEYCIGNLGTPLVLVMGHTKCGALAGATQLVCGPKCNSPSESSEASKQTMLQSLLTSLEPPVQDAIQQLPETASHDEIAAVAIRCNVFHTMRSCLKYSDLLSEKVAEGSMQVHGAVYDITTGRVDFLGPLSTSHGEVGKKPWSSSRQTSSDTEN